MSFLSRFKVLCICGHSRWSHMQYRRGSKPDGCAECACDRYRPHIVRRSWP